MEMEALAEVVEEFAYGAFSFLLFVAGWELMRNREDRGRAAVEEFDHSERVGVGVRGDRDG